MENISNIHSNIIIFSLSFLICLLLSIVIYRDNKKFKQQDSENDEFEAILREKLKVACETLDAEVLAELYSDLAILWNNTARISKDNGERYEKIRLYIKGKHGGLTKNIHEIEEK